MNATDPFGNLLMLSEKHAERASIPLGYQGNGLELRQQSLDMEPPRSPSIWL